MKKLLALLLSAFLLFSLVACGPDNPPDNTPSDGGTPDGGTTDGSTPSGGSQDSPDDGIIGSDSDPAVPDIDWDLPT